jgi:hypothetical protein
MVATQDESQRSHKAQEQGQAAIRLQVEPEAEAARVVLHSAASGLE